MNRLFILSALFMLGCATMGNQSESPTLPTLAEMTQAATKASSAPLANPAELGGEIGQAERMGTMIFQQDQASAAGNDALLANTTSEERAQLGGQVSQPEANDDGTATGSWIVQFITNEPAPKIQFRVRVFMDSQKPAFEKLIPPLEASAHLLRLIDAQKTALNTIQKSSQTGQKTLRPIVFPVEMNQQRLFIVYLLAGTPQSDKATFGQHFRVVVSADGKAVNRQTTLASDPLEIALNASKRPLAVVHKETIWPNETHVYASLAHQRPILVGTMKFIWSVENGRISLIEKRPERVVEPESKFDSTNTMNEMNSMNQPDPM